MTATAMAPRITASEVQVEISGAHFDALATVDEGQFVFVQGVEDELHADEGEDRGDPVVQVLELVDEVAEQEVELAQTHQREHVRGEDDERVLA